MKIISGGQTGADLGGLEGAKAVGLETGGTAPQGYRIEGGSNPELGMIYGLTESPQRNYIARTIKNIVDSDATVIFADDIASPGTALTITMCTKEGKPCLVNPNVQEFRNFVKDLKVVNIAGNRESKAPGLQERVCNLIKEAFEKPKEIVDDDRWVE